MENLGVEKPDYLTRVTEYIPEIIKFIENII
jgi:cysteinyl-tRNA synthetase